MKFFTREEHWRARSYEFLFQQTKKKYSRHARIKEEGEVATGKIFFFETKSSQVHNDSFKMTALVKHI